MSVVNVQDLQTGQVYPLRLGESLRLRLHLDRHLLVRLHLRLQRRGEQRLLVLKHELCLLSLHHCEQLQLGVETLALHAPGKYALSVRCSP